MNTISLSVTINNAINPHSNEVKYLNIRQTFNMVISIQGQTQKAHLKTTPTKDTSAFKPTIIP